MTDAAPNDKIPKAAPSAADRFRKGDLVVYPSHGVGRIDSVGAVEIAGHKLNVIQISFAENAMVLRIPVNKAAGSGLRKLASPEELDKAQAILKGRPRTSRLMWAKRAQEYQAKINSGSLTALAEVVRDLQASADGTASSFSQRNLFELAMDRLAAEFAAVGKVDKATATRQLLDTLQPGKPTEAARSEPSSVEAAD